ncbi:MAG: S-layer homology domain-containing protein [Anaerovoracaceae bacterium]
MKKVFVVCLSAVLILTSFTFSFADMVGNSLRNASGVIVEEDGTITAVEQNGNRVVRLGSDGFWETLAGATLVDNEYGEAFGGYLDGANLHALFEKPTCIVKYSNGYAVSDTGNNVIRLVTPKITRTLSGSGKADLINGVGEGAAFNRPTGLATDEDGNLYIADTGNNAVRMMDKKGKVTTLVSGLSAPMGLAWLDGSLYIADTGNHRVVRYSIEEKKLFDVAGDENETVFSNPIGLALDSKTGAVFVGDCGNNAIKMIKNGIVSTVLMADALNMEAFPGEPVAMCYLDGFLYVADQDSGIQKINLAEKADRPAAVQVFTDVNEGSWYKDAVNYVYEREFFNGIENTLFSPQASMTRGMFVIVMGRHFQYANSGEIINGDAAFTDVDSNQYYAGSAAWAADNGIVNGMGYGMFAPNNAITRQQMAVIMYNYTKMLGGDVSISSEARVNMSSMPDSAAVAGWADDAVAWAVGHEIIKGKDGNLAPNDTATRAEVAQIIFNFEKSGLI